MKTYTICVHQIKNIINLQKLCKFDSIFAGPIKVQHTLPIFTAFTITTITFSNTIFNI